MVFMIFFLFICSAQKKRGCPFVRYSIPQAKLLCHKNRQNLVNFAQIGLWILFRSSLPRRFVGRAVFVRGFFMHPAMHPGSSKFYQKIVFPPFHLIFSGLAPCFCFLKLFQADKFLNEICFFSANSTVYLLILQGFYV